MLYHCASCMASLLASAGAAASTSEYVAGEALKKVALSHVAYIYGHAADEYGTNIFISNEGGNHTNFAPRGPPAHASL